MAKKRPGELTDKEKFSVWESRTEDTGIFESAVQSMALFGSLTPPASAEHGRRKVREWPEPRRLRDSFRL